VTLVTAAKRSFAKLENYEYQYRGAVIFWSFDREKGRINKEKSFAVEVPPYAQDLASSGKLASDGWPPITCVCRTRALDSCFTVSPAA
jgi:nitrous-oxide reductase